MLARILPACAFIASSAFAASNPDPLVSRIDSYVVPFVATNNFAGEVLAARAGVPLYLKAFGFADDERRLPNTLHNRFHIASMSMQFTTAAALRLIASGKLSLDTPVTDILPDYPNGSAITVRHLLTETSGIADINAQADYSEVLKTHQTPESLVVRVQNLPSRNPGTFEREEHTAFNLLALIIEKKTGLTFAKALHKLVFAPLHMTESGIDEDQWLVGAAKGYEPEGLYGLAPADRIHWSAKAGNGSAYTTASDELKFVEGLYRDDFMPPQLRSAIFDLGTRVGYGI